MLITTVLAAAPPTPTLIELVSPKPEARVGLGGIEVFVRFRTGDVEPATFRVLLNGADVTELFDTGGNGAYGQLYALLDGENRLRVEVFGRGWLPGSRLYPQAREIRVHHRRPLDSHRG